MTAPADRVPLATKLAFGFGSVAYGIKDNGFSVFLLLFYNQVIGLPADQVGLAIMFALFVDAFIDPAVGVMSDRTHSRWGRRHPWLYGSALPIALSWILLWNPPETTPTLTLAWLVVVAILVRGSVSVNEVPSVAMNAELTRDYHERTAVIRYRYLFGWAGGLTMLVLAYGVFLAPPHGAPTGPLARQGYSTYALVGAAIILVSVIGSALGTHRLLARPPARRLHALGFRDELRGMRHTLSNRAFLLLMAAALFAYINQGITFALANYLLGFVWRFGPADFTIYALSLFGGATLAFLMVTPLARRLGKKGAAALCSIVSCLLATAPYLLFAIDRFPAAGTAAFLPLLLGAFALATGFGVCILMLVGSMTSDVVEASEERTGRREEGLFYAGNFFMQKCTTGLGIFFSGAILTFAAFPAKAVPGAVPPDSLERLALAYAAATIGLGCVSALVFTRFPITRAAHEARLAKLAVAAPGDGG
jgi:glycoside/pentoside/hexuronide:cation symporter, GPH family